MFDPPHLASRVFGAPLMIARAKLEVILDLLAPRLAKRRCERRERVEPIRLTLCL